MRGDQRGHPHFVSLGHLNDVTVRGSHVPSGVIDAQSGGLDIVMSQDRRMSLGVIQPGFVDCQAIGVAVDCAQVEDKVRYLGIQGSAAHYSVELNDAAVQLGNILRIRRDGHLSLCVGVERVDAMRDRACMRRFQRDIHVVFRLFIVLARAGCRSIGVIILPQGRGCFQRAAFRSGTAATPAPPAWRTWAPARSRGAFLGVIIIRSIPAAFSATGMSFTADGAVLSFLPRGLIAAAAFQLLVDLLVHPSLHSLSFWGLLSRAIPRGRGRVGSSICRLVSS